MLNDPEVSGKILFAIYLAAGIPVAWLHIRQQRMLESVRQVRQPQAQSLLLYTLAVMWPILLFAMALTYLQSKPRRQREPIEGPPQSGSEVDRCECRI